MLTGKRWLKHHLETFVKPNLDGKLPNLTDHPLDSNLKHLRDEANPKALLELWTEAKKRAQGRIILLPGRDVWLFEVLARLDGTKTIFRADISALTRDWVSRNDPDRELFKACYCVDSGILGSIPKALGCVDWGLVYWSTGLGPNRQLHQLLPHACTEPYYTCYSVLECIHKYWTRASMVGLNYSQNKINQVININKAQFEVATLGTMLVANYWLKVQPPRKMRRLTRKVT